MITYNIESKTENSWQSVDSCHTKEEALWLLKDYRDKHSDREWRAMKVTLTEEQVALCSAEKPCCPQLTAQERISVALDYAHAVLEEPDLCNARHDWEEVCRILKG